MEGTLGRCWTAEHIQSPLACTCSLWQLLLNVVTATDGVAAAVGATCRYCLPNCPSVTGVSSRCWQAPIGEETSLISSLADSTCRCVGGCVSGGWGGEVVQHQQHVTSRPPHRTHVILSCSTVCSYTMWRACTVSQVVLMNCDPQLPLLSPNGLWHLVLFDLAVYWPCVWCRPCCRVTDRAPPVPRHLFWALPCHRQGRAGGVRVSGSLLGH